jgi:hypothetical protein
LGYTGSSVSKINKYKLIHKGNENQNNIEIPAHSGMAIIKKTQQMLIKVEGKRTLIHCWWKFKLVQPPWKAVWRFLTNLKVELPYYPAIPLLGIYLKECKSGYSTNTCTLMFLAVLIIIAKLWNQSKCHPSIING